jgi:hypothetical protein
MARYKYKAEQVVTNIIIESCFEIFHQDLACIHLASIKLAAEFLMLALQACVTTEVIDGSMFRRSHEPGARIVG